MSALKRGVMLLACLALPLAALHAANAPHSPVLMVEFYDLNCPHCHEQQPVLDALAKNKPHLPIRYVPIAMFGAEDWQVTALLIAAKQQGHYAALHQALIHHPLPIDIPQVKQAAEQLHINWQQLVNAAHSASVRQTLIKNVQTWHHFGGDGVPYFLIGNNQHVHAFTSTQSLNTLLSTLQHL